MCSLRIRVLLTSQNELQSVPFSSVFENSFYKISIFPLKHMIPHDSKFLCGKVFEINFLSLIDIGLLKAVSSCSISKHFSINLFHLNCQIYWIKLFTVFPYYLFNAYTIYSDKPLFHSSSDNLCSPPHPPFVLISLARSY